MTTDGLFDLIVVHTYQVSVVGIFICGFVWLLAKDRPHLAHAAWALVLLKCVVPPVFSSPTSLFMGSHASHLEESSGSLLSPPITHGNVAENALLWNQDLSAKVVKPLASPAPPSSNQSTDSLTKTQVARSVLERPTRWALYLWMTGVIIAMLSLVIKLSRFYRHLRRNSYSEQGPLFDVLQSLSTRIGLRCHVGLLLVDAPNGTSPIGPAVVGIFRPKVLMPRVLVNEMNDEQLQILLTHELIHIQRHDLWWVIVQTIATSVCWFNPFAWFASSALTREAERACDEQTIANLGCTGAAYARTLLEVMQRKHQMRSAPVLPGVRPLDVNAKRMERVMRLKHGSLCRSPFWVAVLLFVGCCLILPGARATEGQSSLGSKDMKGNAGGMPTDTLGADSSKELTIVEVTMAVVRTDAELADVLVKDWKSIPSSKKLESHFGKPADATLKETVHNGDAWLNFKESETVDTTQFLWTELSGSEGAVITRKLKEQPNAVVVSEPRIKCYEGQSASVTVFEQRPFFVGLDPEGGTHPKPRVENVNEGFRYDLKPVVDQSGKSLKLILRSQHTHVMDVGMFTFKLPAIDESETGVSPEDPTTIQIPIVSRHETALDVELALDQRLLIRTPLPDRESTQCLLTSISYTLRRVVPQPVEFSKTEAAKYPEPTPDVYVDCGIRFTKDQIAALVQRLRERKYGKYVIDGQRLLVPHRDISLVHSLAMISMHDVQDDDVVELTTGENRDGFDPSILENMLAAHNFKLRIKGSCDYVIDNDGLELKASKPTVRFGSERDMVISADRMEVAASVDLSRASILFKGNVKVDSKAAISAMADMLVVDTSDEKMFMQGNVRGVLGETKVSAQKIYASIESGMLELIGDVSIDRPGYGDFSADRVRWNPETNELAEPDQGGHDVFRPRPNLNDGLPIDSPRLR